MPATRRRCSRATSSTRRPPSSASRGIQLPCPHTPHEAFDVAAELLRAQPECTAAITTGWQFTGLLGALRAVDLHVPDDFSVVSIIASQYAEMLSPALTNIEWPAFEAGRRAAEMLIERLADDRALPQQDLIGAELVIRETTARPGAEVAEPGGELLGGFLGLLNRLDGTNSSFGRPSRL